MLNMTWLACHNHSKLKTSERVNWDLGKKSSIASFIEGWLETIFKATFKKVFFLDSEGFFATIKATLSRL